MYIMLASGAGKMDTLRHPSRHRGGEADLSSGSVRLDDGGWDHRLLVSSETALDASKTVGVGAVVLSPEDRETEYSVGTRFNWRF